MAMATGGFTTLGMTTGPMAGTVQELMFRSSMVIHIGTVGSMAEEDVGDIHTMIHTDGTMAGAIDGTTAGAVATAVGVATTTGDGDMILISEMDGVTITTIGVIETATEMDVGTMGSTLDLEGISEIELQAETTVHEAQFIQEVRVPPVI